MAGYTTILAFQLLWGAARCLDYSLPFQTAVADDQLDILGWTPKPTAVPAMGRMLRRDQPRPSGTCGYVTGNKCKNVPYGHSHPKTHKLIGARQLPDLQKTTCSAAFGPNTTWWVAVQGITRPMESTP